MDNPQSENTSNPQEAQPNEANSTSVQHEQATDMETFGKAPSGQVSKPNYRQLRKWPVIAISLFLLTLSGICAWGYLGPKSPFEWAASTSAKIDAKPGPGKSTVVMAHAPESVSINPAAPQLNLPSETAMTGNGTGVNGNGHLEGSGSQTNTGGNVSDYDQQARMQREQMQMQLEMQRQQEAAQRYQQRLSQLQTVREANSTVYSADPGNQQQSTPNSQNPLQGQVSTSNASTYLPHTRLPAVSPYEVKAGTVIPSVMLSGINSDLPGDILAQVVQNVYDSATGRYLIIPQGAKLVGTYDHNLVIGQQRVIITWDRIIYPDSSSVSLADMSGQDQSGYAGFKDKVNHHTWAAVQQALLLSAISAGAQLSQPRAQRGDYSYSAPQIGAAALGQQLNQLGMLSYSNRANMQPTITIRPGYRFNVFVNKDMILTPWQAGTLSYSN
jgi:type IV secretory pathway VirB10-like protein